MHKENLPQFCNSLFFTPQSSNVLCESEKPFKTHNEWMHTHIYIHFILLEYSNERKIFVNIECLPYICIVYCNTDFSLFTSSMDKDGKCCVALSFSLFRYVFFFHFYSYVFITFVTCTKGRRDKYTMEIVDVFQLML